jgi:hypothetical protein
MGRIKIFSGTGAGGFSEVGAFPSEQAGYSFWTALGDFGGGGDVDVVTVGSQLSVLANNGFGTLSPAFTAPLGIAQTDAFVADVNGDGRPDVILGSAALQIFLNEPTSPAAGQAAPLPAAQPGAPSVQDARESARRWRESGARDRRGRRKAPTERRETLPYHTTFSFSLNEQATVNLSFSRRAGGRSVAGGCAASSSKDSEHRVCERGGRRNALRRRSQRSKRGRLCRTHLAHEDARAGQLHGHDHGHEHDRALQTRPARFYDRGVVGRTGTLFRLAPPATDR